MPRSLSTVLTCMCLPQRRQDFLASRRKLISRMQTFGESERLQFPYPRFEVSYFEAEIICQKSRICIRHRVDHFQKLFCPGASFTVLIEFCKLGKDLREFGFDQIIIFAKCNARVFAGEVYADSVDRVVAIAQAGE